MKITLLALGLISAVYAHTGRNDELDHGVDLLVSAFEEAADLKTTSLRGYEGKSEEQLEEELRWCFLKLGSCEKGEECTWTGCVSTETKPKTKPKTTTKTTTEKPHEHGKSEEYQLELENEFEMELEEEERFDWCLFKLGSCENKDDKCGVWGCEKMTPEEKKKAEEEKKKEEEEKKKKEEEEKHKNRKGKKIQVHLEGHKEEEHHAGHKKEGHEKKEEEHHAGHKKEGHEKKEEEHHAGHKKKEHVAATIKSPRSEDDLLSEEVLAYIMNEEEEGW